MSRIQAAHDAAFATAGHPSLPACWPVSTMCAPAWVRDARLDEHLTTATIVHAGQGTAVLRKAAVNVSDAVGGPPPSPPPVRLAGPPAVASTSRAGGVMLRKRRSRRCFLYDAAYERATALLAHSITPQSMFWEIACAA